MKTKLFLLALVAFAAFEINAQCVVSGSFVARNAGAYPLSGTASITVESDGSVSSVNFESDFVSVQGFQLQVFLSKTQTINTTNPNPSVFIRVDQNGDLRDDPHNSDLRSHNGHDMTGAKAFTQNLSGVEIDDYQYVILQCVEFNVPWGYAQLTNQSPDCSTLSTGDTTLNESISIFPNPANEQFEVRNDLETPIAIAVYNVLGKQVQVIENTQLKNQSVSLSNLNAGIYLVEIKSDKQRLIKKLVKR